MSADLARRVHDLLRQPRARELFQRHAKEYLSWRMRKRGRTKKHKNGRIEHPPAPYFPFDRFDDCGPAPDEPFPDVTLAEKFAVLAAHHDNHYGNDGPVLPRPDLDVIQFGDRESFMWHFVLDHVKDHLHRYPSNVEDWYKDVEADCAAGSNTTVRRNPKDRDNYIYFAIHDGTALKEIKNKVNANKDWQPLDQLPSVSAAARRFARRHNLPWPIAR